MKLIHVCILSLLIAVVCSGASQGSITCLHEYEDHAHKAHVNSTTLFKCMTNETDGSYRFTMQGTTLDNGSIEDPRAITGMHTFDEAAPQSFNVTLTIEGSEYSESKKIPVTVVEANHTERVRKARQDALWYLHQNINRYEKGDTRFGFWINNMLRRWSVAYTANAITAMQVAGYEAGSEHPYGQDIERGLNHILSKCRAQMIGEQYSGQPDINNNSIGLKCSNFRQHTNYEVSMSLLAIALSDPEDRNEVLKPFIYNRTNRQVARDIVDWLLWAQNENIAARGGYGAWYYTPNNANGDMSVSQWPTFAIRAAKKNFNLSVPDWVSEDLKSWLKDSQMESGAFTYRGREDTPIDNVAMTASGLIQTAYAGYSEDSRTVEKGIDYLVGNWYINETRDRNKHLGNFYAMQGVDKVCSIFNVSVEEENCTRKYQEFLLAQQEDGGYWKDSSYLQIHVDSQLATAWGVIILEDPVLFTSLYQDYR